MITVRRLEAVQFFSIDIGHIVARLNHVVSGIATADRFLTHTAGTFIAFLTGRKRESDSNSNEKNLFHEVNLELQKYHIKSDSTK